MSSVWLEASVQRRGYAIIPDDIENVPWFVKGPGRFKWIYPDSMSGKLWPDTPYLQKKFIPYGRCIPRRKFAYSSKYRKKAGLSFMKIVNAAFIGKLDNTYK